MFYVYLLHSERDTGLYIGFSTDLRRRLSEHKSGASQSTNFRGPWNLIYYEAYTEEADALGRERYLKSGGGRKFGRSQLRNYFEKHPLRTKGTEPFSESRGPGLYAKAQARRDDEEVKMIARVPSVVASCLLFIVSASAQTRSAPFVIDNDNDFHRYALYCPKPDYPMNCAGM